MASETLIYGEQFQSFIPNYKFEFSLRIRSVSNRCRFDLVSERGVLSKVDLMKSIQIWFLSVADLFHN